MPLDRICAEMVEAEPAAQRGRSVALMILVTGGAGFIGANFVHQWFESGHEAALVLDKLTYAGNLGNLADLMGRSGFHFGSCRYLRSDRAKQRVLTEHRPALSFTLLPRATSIVRSAVRRNSSRPISPGP